VGRRIRITIHTVPKQIPLPANSISFTAKIHYLQIQRLPLIVVKTSVYVGLHDFTSTYCRIVGYVLNGWWNWLPPPGFWRCLKLSQWAWAWNLILLARRLLPRDARRASAARYCYRKSSVRLSVTLMYAGHIGWTSSKLFTWIISLGSSLLGATTSAI